MTTCDGLGSEQILLHISGLTYRKLLHWTDCGWLVSHTHDPAGRTGSGITFCWALTEVAAAERIVRLTSIGFGLDAAVRLARSRARLTAAKCLLEALAVDAPDDRQSITGNEIKRELRRNAQGTVTAEKGQPRPDTDEPVLWVDDLALGDGSTGWLGPVTQP